MGRDIQGRNQVNFSRDSDTEYEITGSIKTQEELLRLQRMPQYKTDAGFRDQVMKALARGMQEGHEVRVADPKPAGPDNKIARAMVAEKARELFASPLYKTSETYRQGVYAYIRENGFVHDELNKDTQIHNYLANGERHQVSIEAGRVGDASNPSK